MKILFLVNILPNNKTGVFNSVFNRINQFRDNNVEFEIYNLHFYDNTFLKYLKKTFGVKAIKPIPDFREGGLFFKALNCQKGLSFHVAEKFGLQYLYYFFVALSFKKALGSTSLISVHWGLSCGILGYWLKRFTGIPLFVTYHGSDVHTIPKQNKGWSFCLKQTMKFANGNIFVSKDLHREAEKLGPVYNPEILYNGINKNNFKKLGADTVQRNRKNLCLNGIIVGFVGNLVEVKNADLLPDIFLKISQNLREPCSFIIVGNGELADSIDQKLKSYSLSYHMAGKLPPNQIPEIMSCMDLLVLPSRREAFGMVLWEALCCGVPSIGSRVGGIPEAIGLDNTIDFAESNYLQKFADLAVRRIQNKDEKSNIKVLSWEDVFEKEIRIYKNI